MKWISVKERLPEKRGEWCLVYFGGIGVAACWRGQWYEDPSDGILLERKVTHWMSLPPPPGQEVDERREALEEAAQRAERWARDACGHWTPTDTALYLAREIRALMEGGEG